MKPILFNTEMVKAILVGRKTQTRRVTKEINIVHKDDVSESHNGVVYRDDKDRLYFKHNIIEEFSKYKKGDILYVRETFSEDFGEQHRIVYKAEYKKREEPSIKWKPSIHMPKEYARIFLKVTNV